MDKNKSLGNKENKGLISSIQNVFSSLFGGFDPDKEKKRLLKEIKKELKKRNKFYRLKGDVALSGLAKAFYEMYLTVGPAQILFEKYANSELLKEILIESFFSDRQRGIIENLSVEKLKERAQGTDLRILKEEAKEDLVQLYSSLDSPTIKKINGLYNSLLILKDFLSFDFYFFLKKFDSMLPEQDFNYNPRFENINGEYILEDLKDFLVVFSGLNEQIDWDYLFDVLKNYRNLDLVSRDKWRKIMQIKREIMRSRILHNIIMHLEKNPYYKPKIEIPNYEIVEPYLSKRKNDVEQTLKNIFQDKKDRQIDQLLNHVFGTTAISRTQFYTDKESVLLQKKSNDGFTYVKPVNYLKAFFLDYYKNDVRKLIDILLIHGKWATSILSQQLSDTYHQLLAFSDQLIEFDNSLAEDGNLGVRLRRVVRMANKDRGAQSSLRETLNDINGKARKIINNSAQYLISLGKYIKNLISDHKEAKAQMIINWKELESVTGSTIDEQLGDVYKRIYYFIQLLQFYVKAKEQSKEPE